MYFHFINYWLIFIKRNSLYFYLWISPFLTVDDVSWSENGWIFTSIFFEILFSRMVIKIKWKSVIYWFALDSQKCVWTKRSLNSAFKVPTDTFNWILPFEFFCVSRDGHNLWLSNWVQLAMNYKFTLTFRYKDNYKDTLTFRYNVNCEFKSYFIKNET